MSDHCQSLKREVVCQKSEGPALVPRPRVMVHQARWDTCGKTAGSKQVALCSLHSASKADDPTKMGGIAPFASPLELLFFFLSRFSWPDSAHLGDGGIRSLARVEIRSSRREVAA